MWPFGVSVPVCTVDSLFHSLVRDDAVDDDVVLERGLLAVSDEMWALAVRRAEVIGPLADAGTAGGDAAVSYTHLTLPTTLHECRSRWSPYH